MNWRGRSSGSPPDSPAAGEGPEVNPDDDDDDDTDFDDDREPGSRRWSFGPVEFFTGGEGMNLHRRTFSRRIETGNVARLRISNRNGGITIRAHDQPAITIDVVAELYAANGSEADEELERIKQAIISEGDRVDISTPDLMRPDFMFFGRGPKVDYEIRVPAETEVQASNRNGLVSLSGTRRPAQIENRNGRVAVDDLQAELRAENHNGRTTVLRNAGPVTIQGHNGHITIEKATGAIAVETRNSTVDIAQPGGAVRASSSNGSIRYSGNVAGEVDLEAANGSIRMAVPRDSRFEIDAESRHGSVRSDLSVRESGPVEGQGPAPKVRLRTRNGSIHLTEI